MHFEVQAFENRQVFFIKDNEEERGSNEMSEHFTKFFVTPGTVALDPPPRLENGRQPTPPEAKVANILVFYIECVSLIDILAF